MAETTTPRFKPGDRVWFWFPNTKARVCPTCGKKTLQEHVIELFSGTIMAPKKDAPVDEYSIRGDDSRDTMLIVFHVALSELHATREEAEAARAGEEGHGAE